MFKLVIHGGAGVMPKDLYSAEDVARYKAALNETLDVGLQVLKKKGTAIDAVAAAVASLENNPLFNAGRGSVLASNGRIQMDASIMCGATQRAGAVTLIETIKNPVYAAKAVMEKTPHRILGGSDAEEFAKTQNLQIMPLDYFRTETRVEQLKQAIKQGVIALDHDVKENSGTDNSNTVGAVALDVFGNVAAATSTGGMTNKMPGRVSDTSIIGAGTFADNRTLAISATGTGDVFIQNVTGHEAHALMLYGQRSLQDACKQALDQVKAKGGYGGLIAVTTFGEVFLGFNSGGMFRGQVDDSGSREVGIS